MPPDPSCFQMNLLDFRLHEFTRVTWASRRAREVWEPRIEALQETLVGLRDPILASDDCDCWLRLDRVYPYRVEEIEEELQAGAKAGAGAGLKELIAERLDVSEVEMSRFSSKPFAEDDRLCFLLVGEPDALDRARAAVQAGDFAAPGYPFNRTHPGLQFSRGGSLEGDPGSAGARAPRAAWATPPGAAWWR